MRPRPATRTLLVDPLLPTASPGAGARHDRRHPRRPPRHPHHDPVPRAQLRGALAALPQDAETTIHGHRACAKRLKDESAFREIEPDTPLPGGVTAHTIGKPRRYETPLHLPSHDALVFGDAVAEVDGRLVVWATDKVDAKVERFYRERFNPTLEPLLELPFDAVLATHGQPLLTKGKRALKRALEARPWYHHG